MEHHQRAIDPCAKALIAKGDRQIIGGLGLKLYGDFVVLVVAILRRAHPQLAFVHVDVHIARIGTVVVFGEKHLTAGFVHIIGDEGERNRAFFEAQGVGVINLYGVLAIRHIDRSGLHDNSGLNGGHVNALRRVGERAIRQFIGEHMRQPRGKLCGGAGPIAVFIANAAPFLAVSKGIQGWREGIKGVYACGLARSAIPFETNDAFVGVFVAAQRAPFAQTVVVDPCADNSDVQFADCPVAGHIAFADGFEHDGVQLVGVAGDLRQLAALEIVGEARIIGDFRNNLIKRRAGGADRVEIGVRIGERAVVQLALQQFFEPMGHAFERGIAIAIFVAQMAPLIAKTQVINTVCNSVDGVLRKKAAFGAIALDKVKAGFDVLLIVAMGGFEFGKAIGGNPV